jgi:ligand-binding sensor domain-containing protein
LSSRNSNISREGRAERTRPYQWLLACLMAVCSVSTAGALDVNKAVSEYVREQWGAGEGFGGGQVYAIAQTPDGYLWIGAEKGLFRFDGLRFNLFQRSDSPTFPGAPVLGLAVDSEGSLWVREQGPRLIRYRDGVFRDVITDLQEAEASVTAMCVEKSGDVLFSGLVNGTFRYTRGKFLTLASRIQQPRLVISLAEEADGKIWVGTRESGLFFIREGQVYRLTKELQDRKINSLLPMDGRELWVGTDDGVVRWNGTRLSPVAPSSPLSHIQALTMIRDRDSNVWVGTSSGLFRVNARGVSSLAGGDQRSTGEVTALFEDREGNLWVGAARGIVRLREAVFTTYSTDRGLPSDSIGPLYIDSEGRTWFAPVQGGLYWLKDGEIRSEKAGGLDGDVIYSIAGGKGGLWLGRQKGGLTHLRFMSHSLTNETYTQAQGLAQNTIYAVHESRDGTVWAGTLSAGLTSFKNGRFSTYTTANGLASNTISSIAEASDGTMWFGTPNGANALSNGQWLVYTSSDGLPPGTVNCLFQDSKGTLWIGTANGLAFIRMGSVLTPHEAPEALREEILGIEEDRAGWLWIATSNHVLRVNRDKLLGLALSQEDVRDYGLADGLHSMEGVRRHQSVVADSQGRIWFSTSNGLSFVDPARAPGSSIPAMVHIEGITADGRRIKLESPIRIAAPHQRITLAYAGLSLSVPARVRFKFKLDGFDKDWSEPVANREATYTNLGAGSYLFHVLASNSDGLWNGAERVIQFEIKPVFWQTWWFLLATSLALALLLLALIRLRLLQLTRQLQVRFEERLAERTRIAQALHDTLLQGFLSASMQLDIADDRLPPDSPAKPLITRALSLMRQVIEEGRNAVRGLRSQAGYRNLEEAFSQIRHEFPTHTEIGFRVIVEGAPRPLGLMIRDDVYFIGHEALSNAFRHSRATAIEVEIEYAANQLRLLIRDNGCGIDTHVLQGGREGHWGLSGMRERAGRIGSKLKVLSRAMAGTEVELTVPAKIAYEPQRRKRSLGWLYWLYPEKERSEKPQSESERTP